MWGSLFNLFLKKSLEKNEGILMSLPPLAKWK